MTNELQKAAKTRVVTRPVARRSFGCNDSERVARALDLVLRNPHFEANPIEERLKQCPEATCRRVFKFHAATGRGFSQQRSEVRPSDLLKAIRFEVSTDL
jgi:hypothetical protein